MYCKNCGKELSANETVCSNCNTSTKDQKLFKNKKVLAIIVGAVLLGLILGCVIFGASGKDDTDNNATTESASASASDVKDKFASMTQESNNATTTASSTEDSKQTASTQTNKNKVYKSGTLVSPLKFSTTAGQAQGKSSVKFQSLYSFAKDYLDFKEPSENDHRYRQQFSCSEDQVKIITDYVKTLGQSGMNLKEVDPYYREYDGETFASWGFNYTGTASVKETCDSTFADDAEPCAVDIYYMIEYGSCKGIVSWSADLSSEDLGFRYGGKTVSAAPGGKSVGAGLVRTSDGKYQTSDGRFSVSLNQATVISNNVKQNCTLTYEDTNYSDALKIKGSNEQDIFRIFFSSIQPLQTGIIYDYEDLLTSYQWSSADGPISLGIETTRVYQCINNKWLTPTYNDSPYEDMTLRVVYYDKNEEVAVFYVYTKVNTETELFCAVDLSKAIKPSQSSSGSSGSSSGGGYISGGSSSSSSRCRYCGGRGYTTCTTCNGRGYYSISGSTPNYSGSAGSNSYYELKECPGINCRGGLKDCPHC